MEEFDIKQTLDKELSKNTRKVSADQMMNITTVSGVMFI